MSELPRDTESELAALADGSLAPELRERAVARVRASSELQDALAEQRRAVELTAAVEVRAPASLHREVQALLAPADRRRGIGKGGVVRHAGVKRSVARRDGAKPRLGLVAAGAGALAAIIVLAVGLSGGGSSGLSVQRAAALTLSPSTMAAPAESSAHRAQLAASVGGVPFPYWKEHFGWRGSGARNDRLDGRSVMTVFYADREGRRIGYAIVSGPAPTTDGGTVVRRWGVPYRVLAQDGATVVVWQRNGHLCIVSGRGVSARTLLSLASWDSQQPRAA